MRLIIKAHKYLKRWRGPSGKYHYQYARGEDAKRGTAQRLMEGIVGRQGREFTMEDGEDFIRELPYAITGSVMRAKLV